MSVADVVQQLGAANGWSEDEVLQDTKELMRNRLRTVRDLRRMTAQGWSELSSLLPVVKDLLRQAIQ
ncbi:hypothetical protein DFJ73DRAFT_851687 [Zopfochytrium polystomum]|nr:hypothetical protein DFJ73DRAFT_851687 [Zopfochytrium polystomum]